MRRFPVPSSALAAVSLLPVVVAQQVDAPPAPSVAVSATPAIHALLEQLGPDAQMFDMHMTTLSNPYMEGRVPGSRGMEVARDYFEHWLKLAGTMPPFEVEGKQGTMSYRQPFPMGAQPVVKEQMLKVGERSFEAGKEFAVLGASGSGEVTAPVTFIGYGIQNGREGYTSFPNDEQLEGKIALVFRFEPMDADGKSQWSSGNQAWSQQSGLGPKLAQAIRRKAAGLILVNPPGAADPRARELMRAGGGGSTQAKPEFPVVHVSNAAAEALVAAVAPAGTTLSSLRQQADSKGGVMAWDRPVTMMAKIEPGRLHGENVAGMIPGKGALKNEWIVIGGHLDHLGTGLYGARDSKRIGQLHPGADDNASGSAAVLMLAEKLMQDYAAMPEGQPARSILLAGWDAEEAGLYGSRYYVDNPVGEIEKHALAINFDMIGRIVNKRLSVSGLGSARGMEDWLKPLFEACPLDEVTDAGMGFGGSDHMSFAGKRVPYLFAIIKDFHNDYHTPDDVAWKINREDAVHTIQLFHQIALTAATRTEPFEWQNASSGRRRARANQDPAGGETPVPAEAGKSGETKKG